MHPVSPRPTPTALNAILRICCPDRPGIVAALTGFIFRNGGNIVHLDQHVDPEADVFFARIEWQVDGFQVPRARLGHAIAELVQPFDAMSLSLDFDDRRPRMAIWGTRESHGLYDLLTRFESGELGVDIPLIMSNHEILRPHAEKFGIPFHHLPITPETRAEQEERQLALLRDHDIDVVILARYMQILSEPFLEAFARPNPANPL